MRLRLSYAAEPENAALFAADVVALAGRVSGTVLDYTPGSLRQVDEILDGIREDGTTSDDIPETMFSFGCYIGEVMTRHGGGAWRRPSEQEASVFGVPMVVEMPSKCSYNPIGKAFKRLDNGPEDSVSFFYNVATTEDPS
ncbi:hypothetical protein [Streptacidiphilus rugosus]|uniref:hypothetical protein n=1 Tax=Streptacidiphilus rugosus TaxID=405783 RepID=UPI000561D4B6|nr:hypothetical protein [Streptacidiphilus rugosus]